MRDYLRRLGRDAWADLKMLWFQLAIMGVGLRLIAHYDGGWAILGRLLCFYAFFRAASRGEGRGYREAIETMRCHLVEMVIGQGRKAP